MATLTFSTETLTYDQSEDTITTEVFHKSDDVDPIATRFEIVLNYDQYRYSIEDHSGACPFDPADLAPFVLSAFIRAFARNYNALPHDASPDDVETFDFTVEYVAE